MNLKIEQDADSITIIVDGKRMEPISTSGKFYTQIFAEVFEKGVEVGMDKVINTLEQEIEGELKDCGFANGR